MKICCCKVTVWIVCSQYSKIATFGRTFPKLILVHLVLLVKRPTEAVPPEAPPDVDWSATQFTVMVVLAAPPDSMTQTPNPLLVTSAVHTTADPWTLGDATTWLIEATTRTLAEPVNLSGKTTSWQRVFEDVTFRASFPCWMELPVGKRTNKFMRLWTKAMRQQLSLSLLRVINVKFPLQPHQKYYITQYGELWLSLLRWKMLILRTNSHYTSLYTFPLWKVAPENVIFELRSERHKNRFKFRLSIIQLEKK